MNTKVYNMECVAMSTNVLRAFGYVCSITLCMHLCITQQPYLLLTQNFGFGFCYMLPTLFCEVVKHIYS